MSLNYYIAGSGKNQRLYDFLSNRIPTIGYTSNKDVNLFIAARKMYIITGCQNENHPDCIS